MLTIDPREAALPVLALSLALGGCVAPTTNGGAPSVPAGAPVPAAQIPALVDGGPYDVRIFDGADAGTVARIDWDFATSTVSGSFTAADGTTGTFSRNVSIDGDLLCTTGAAGTPECHAVYPYETGFMEVTPSGEVHAVSRPI